MEDKTYTAREVKNWYRFERVRSEGAYNMFDPRARESTGMTSHDYFFVMDNYSEIKEQIEQNK